MLPFFRWERSSLGKLLSKVSVAEMERAGSSKRLPLLANVNSTDLGVAVDDGNGGGGIGSSGSGSRIHPHHIVMVRHGKSPSSCVQMVPAPRTTKSAASTLPCVPLEACVSGACRSMCSESL